ncbi:MAG: TetR/AcrR family transcriptional regulator [Schwartzia sp.]|nr:TetR/AcrR family transcriptional regulator [Schwartzia sp. (in: firmicutes)]MBO6211074.1 TetR/AcrR family transcriptional regulator [Schwartzia sp. (in: firmicutes)]MBO6294862.1 TetR/AcrR family transcriptional regulator [Schwartzia sp. (in: firmicutes)]MBP3690091.1 TetR/AcrR family transcriptional regulator [Schwartzia sp. (in: firmicutes)]
MRKCGRPPKKENPEENKEKIIRAAIAVVEAQGADAITVRRICEKADVAMGTFYYHFQNKDDLMMYFVRGTDFENIDLLVPMSDIAGRITELYLCLIRQYTRLGATFMQSFYNPKNEALHAYMGEKDGKFAAGTVMARCESELFGAREQGFLKKDADIHQMSADICTIVKGCIFEWCLDNGSVDLEQVATRILRFYFAGQFA